jgi:zinc transporter
MPDNADGNVQPAGVEAEPATRARGAEQPRADGLSWALQFRTADGQQDWEWQHFDLVHAQARLTIEARTELPAFAQQILLGTDESPRIVTDGSVVAGVLPAYARTGDAQAFELTAWHFAMLPHCLITGRRRAARTLVNLWEAVKSGLAPDGPASLIDLCLAEFAREMRARLAVLAANLDPVEDMLIEQRGAGQLNDLGGRLGVIRREATRLKRVLVPLVRALDEDEEELPAWTGFSEHGTGHRMMHGALDDIAALSDRSRSLQDELTTRLAEETNRRLYVVSVVTTLLLPATFVTGYFGMNTGDLPWGGDAAPLGTLYATLLCAVAVLGTLLLLRWKRLL